MARPVAYGQAFGSNAIVSVPAAASQAFQANSGKFVVMNASYAYLASNASKTDLLGWADVGTFSSSSTAGDLIPVNVAYDGVYEMPLIASRTETYLKGCIGRVCDIIVSSGIQYAATDSSTYDVLRIAGYKYYGKELGEQSVLVNLNYPNLTYSGVV